MMSLISTAEGVMQADFSESLYPINGDEMIYWYKRDPNAALTGMRGLSHDAKSAYNTIIDLLYSRDGDLPDDEHFLCVQIECRPQWWRRVRAELIAAGKIWVLPDGRLMANRVETVLKEAQNFSETQSKLARKGWVSKGKPNESNAPSMPTQQQPDLHPELERESTRSARSSSPKGEFEEGGPRSRRKPRTSLPENFLPINLSDSNRGEFEKFKSFHLAPDSRFASWAQAWRNWELRAAEFNQRGSDNGKGRSVLAAADRLIAHFEEAGATGDYIPGSSGPRPLEMDFQVRAGHPKLISSR
jgi:hypothetical protein